MWIILLDQSESMDEPFRIDRQKPEPGDPAWPEWVPTKLEVARGSLIGPIERIQIYQPLTLLGFAANTWTLFESGSGPRLTARQALEDLASAPGFDVAQALSAAKASFLSTRSSRRARGRTRVLVITHELSDQAGVEQAVKELVDLAETAVTIDVILVDPSDRSRTVAEAIIKQSYLQTATSASHLRAATTSVLLGKGGARILWGARPPEERAFSPSPLPSPTVMWDRESRSRPASEAPAGSADTTQRQRPRSRVIGFPASSIALAAMLLLGSAYLVFSGSSGKPSDIFSSYSAAQDESGILLSWQTHSDDEAGTYRIETRVKPGEVAAVETAVSRVGDSQYSAADNSAEARSGKRLEYRLIYTDASGQETSTPWFGITQVARPAIR